MKLSTYIGNTLFSFDLLLLILFFFIPAQTTLFFIVSVFFHELGHYVVASLFNYNIVEFRISLLGSFVQFKETITKPIHSLLISLAGPFMNFILMIYAYYLNILDLYVISIFLIIINLIPLKTTDGNFILNSIFNLLKINNSEKITNIIGIIVCSVLIILLCLIGQYILAASIVFLVLSTNL